MTTTQPNLWALRPDTYTDRSTLDRPEPCEVCGKGLKPEQATLVEVDITGRILAIGDETIGEATDDTPSQGAFPVGADCLRKVRRLVKAAGA